MSQHPTMVWELYLDVKKVTKSGVYYVLFQSQNIRISLNLIHRQAERTALKDWTQRARVEDGTLSLATHTPSLVTPFFATAGCCFAKLYYFTRKSLRRTDGSRLWDHTHRVTDYVLFSSTAVLPTVSFFVFLTSRRRHNIFVAGTIKVRCCRS